MPIDAWHHYLLLRPLLVFVLAAPLIVFAVLSGGRGRPRRADAKTHDASATSEGEEAPRDVTGGDPQPEGEAHVAASPREWPVSTAGSNQRAA